MVRTYHSAMTGAPVLSDTAGSLKNIVRACLIDGFGSEVGAGWQELFAGTVTNVLCVKPTVPEATGCVLRIDDTGTTNARVRAYESMTDASTGAGPTPMDSQVSGGLWWPKSIWGVKPWTLVADERGFYLAVAPGYSTTSYTLLFAGDIKSYKSGDAYGYLVTGNQSDQSNASDTPDGCLGFSSRTGIIGAYVVRSNTAIGQSVPAQRTGANHNGSTAGVYAGKTGYSFGVYPNGANNGLLTGALELVVAGSVSGTLPGLLHPVQNTGASFTHAVVVGGTDDMAGRRLMAVGVAPPSGSPGGTVFLDVTGPWSR